MGRTRQDAPLIFVDRLKINNRKIEAGVVKGLTAAGFGVNVVPVIGEDAVPCGSVIEVYKKGRVGNWRS